MSVVQPIVGDSSVITNYCHTPRQECPQGGNEGCRVSRIPNKMPKGMFCLLTSAQRTGAKTGIQVAIEGRPPSCRGNAALCCHCPPMLTESDSLRGSRGRLLYLYPKRGTRFLTSIRQLRLDEQTCWDAPLQSRGCERGWMTRGAQGIVKGKGALLCAARRRCHPKGQDARTHRIKDGDHCGPCRTSRGVIVRGHVI